MFPEKSLFQGQEEETEGDSNSSFCAIMQSSGKQTKKKN